MTPRTTAESSGTPHRVPPDVRSALVKKKLLVAYRARPKYQQSGYLVWIIEAPSPDVRARRLARMLEELKRGSGYRSRRWQPRTAPKPASQKQARARARR
jgi:hypothetical protein